MNLANSKKLNLLAVDDHSVVRQLLCDFLHLLGHTAHCVPSAEQAEAILKHQRFDVLLADINLPGMSGIDLAQSAVKIDPGIGIVFVSGFGYLVSDKTDFPFVLLPKPYSLLQLKCALDEVTKSKGGAEDPALQADRD